ncbi:MAG TPA: ArsA-related P-loop ATPase [Pseudobdellovibrionaceae bacterium]|nr:ArsA-related P-loop ATPase [Pseudobdellovibrionaceae bacterium]
MKINKKILICVGTGGVGKTTIAAALGIQAAKEGQKVLVLTIDPSQRLAQALGIDKSQGIRKVDNQDFSGELYASVVHHQEMFDGLIKRAAVRYPGVIKLLENKLYKQLTTSLSGSQEFTSLEALYLAYQSNEYDLIVLDTPPSKHVLDFLKAPQKLIEILNKSVVEWLSDSHQSQVGLFKKILQQGTQMVLKILENLTGKEFISHLAQFFAHLGDWQGQLQERIINMQKLLFSENVQFIMITGPSIPHLAESQSLQREMQKNGATLKSIYVNKAFPSWYLKAKAQNWELKGLASELKSFFDGQDILLKKFEQEQSPEISIYRIPEIEFDIKDFESLKKFTQTTFIGSIKNV